MPNEFDFSRVAYFGDSYSDLGLVYDQTSQVLAFAYPPDLLGYQGSFTNGTVWTEYTSSLLDLETTSSYAVGGAEALGTQSLLEYLQLRGLTGLLTVPNDDERLEYDFNLEAQVDRFLSDSAGENLSGAAAWIFIGLNDYLNFVASNPNPDPLEAFQFVSNVVGATLAQAQELALAGVGGVYITNLPTAQFLPFVSEVPEPIQQLAESGFSLHNYLLGLGVESLKAAGLAVTLVDLETFSEEILADPTTFGFIAPLGEYKVTELGFNPALDGLDDDQYAFWDSLHLNTAGHGVIGAYQAEFVTSEVTIGTQGDDDLDGGARDDLMLLLDGDDEAYAGAGDDVVIAGLGNDHVSGGNGDDIVAGGSQDDILLGDNGCDVLAGGRGNDLLEGGNGDDVLIDGLGSDEAYGGNGDDLFLFTDPLLIGGVQGADWDCFDGGKGHDTLYLALAPETQESVDGQLGGGLGIGDVLDSIGVSTSSIEEYVFLDSRLDLAELDSAARLEEADLWGFV